MKAITVRFHLTHPAEKQAWEKLNSMRCERHMSFSQLIAGAVNAYGTEGMHMSHTEKDALVQEITESVALRLQQMLPAYLAGYLAGVNAPGAAPTAPVHSESQQLTTQPCAPEPDDTMPDFGDSCMDFDFIGG
ncbi:MAG: hypothetical protein ACI4ML_00400 [Aristaeellaceae bacterium]